MAGKKTDGEVVVPQVCKDCKNRAKVEAKLKVSTALNTVIQQFEEKLGTSDVKLSIGDYLKLVQMEQDGEREAVKEIKVTWVNPTVTSESDR